MEAISYEESENLSVKLQCQMKLPNRQLQLAAKSWNENGDNEIPCETEGIFRIFDVKNKGILTADDLVQFMHSIGQFITRSEIHAILASLLVTEPIDLLKFHRITSHELDQGHVSESDVRAAFKVISSNGDHISKSDLERLLLKLGKSLSKHELGEMTKGGDVDGDGLITYGDFLLLISQ